MILIPTARGSYMLRLRELGSLLVGPAMRCVIEIGIAFSSWPRVTGPRSLPQAVICDGLREALCDKVDF